jgi:hypothetical protein
MMMFQCLSWFWFQYFRNCWKGQFCRIFRWRLHNIGWDWRRIKYIINLHIVSGVNLKRKCRKELPVFYYAKYTFWPSKFKSLQHSLRNEVPFCIVSPDPIYWQYIELTYTGTPYFDQWHHQPKKRGCPKVKALISDIQIYFTREILWVWKWYQVPVVVWINICFSTLARARVEFMNLSQRLGVVYVLWLPV